RDERRRNALAEMLGLREVLHDGNEAEYGADDPERRRVDAEALEHLRALLIELLARRNLHIHDVPNCLRLRPVCEQLQAFANERVALLLRHRLEAEQTVAASDLAPADHALEQLLAVEQRRDEDPPDDRESVREHR